MKKENHTKTKKGHQWLLLTSPATRCQTQSSSCLATAPKIETCIFSRPLATFWGLAGSLGVRDGGGASKVWFGRVHCRGTVPRRSASHMREWLGNLGTVDHQPRSSRGLRIEVSKEHVVIRWLKRGWIGIYKHMIVAFTCVRMGASWLFNPN